MKIYLAGGNDVKTLNKFKNMSCIYVLQTYYDLRTWNNEKINCLFSIPLKGFLLDSGAFTFMNSGKKVHWKSYVDEYIEFINQYNIDKFFELDLYTLPEIGIDRTIKIRKYIEYHTKRKSIPVFHACMGLEMYRDLCKEYDYVAIGSSGVTNECRWVQNKNILKQMVRIANSYNTKVHGLGYTRRENINKLEIPFYSVDSISWRLNTGMGYEYYVKHNMILRKHPEGRNQKSREILENQNLKAWIKIQKIKDV